MRPISYFELLVRSRARGASVTAARRPLLAVATVLLLAAVEVFGGESASLQFDNPPDPLLVGRDMRLQLLVSLRDDETSDVTRSVAYTSHPPEIVEISSDGFVTPLADGVTTVEAAYHDGRTALIRITVTGMGKESPVSFPGRIVPIFTKLGCNGGGCHGKAAGQNGFRLSLLGFEPREDYEHLIHESRGRRITPSIPELSLLLRKAINDSPHGGGERMQRDSHEYRMLRRWIAQGMPYGNDSEPVVDSIEVVPGQRSLAAESTQQLAVLAHYSDGSLEDVTRAALYESNDPEMAQVSPSGQVTLGTLVGDVAVMARYQGKVTVFRAIIPLQPPVGAEAPAFADEPDNVIDTYVFQKLQSLGIPASPRCDDATFLRRATLDIAGRLPTLPEVQQFAADTAPQKREFVVDRLLNSIEYAEFFASKWNGILRNREADGATKYSNFAFHAWIRDAMESNLAYDQFVQQIVAASGTVASHPPVAWFTHVSSTTGRMEDAAQLFLGQRLQCAKCHHHPFEKWSQTDYAGMAAFFATVAQKNGIEPNEPSFVARYGDASFKQPKTGQDLPPSGLDSEQVESVPADDVRFAFADWMTNPENPFFARSLVNRYWKHFLGRGLVEPEDDMRVTNPPTNPQLLDAMADAFIDSGYDLKELIRLIVLSQTYQFDSQPVELNLQDRRNYSRYYPKRMQAEVLLDAIDVVTGSPTSFDGLPVGTRAIALPNAGYSSYFLKTFGRSASTTACECESTQEPSLAQNLHLLNSEEIQSKLSADSGRAASLAADDGRSDEEKITELYQVALGRGPHDAELKSTLSYLAGKENRRQAYEDVVWTLINSKEFLFNH